MRVLACGVYLCLLLRFNIQRRGLSAFEEEATYGTFFEQEYNGLEAHLADIGGDVFGFSTEWALSATKCAFLESLEHWCCQEVLCWQQL
jgi:hypothetical protein